MRGSFQLYVFTYFQLALGAIFFLMLTWDEFKRNVPLLLIAACLILPVVPIPDMTSFAVQGSGLVETEKPLTHTKQLYQTPDVNTTLVGNIIADQAYSYWGTRYYATPVHFRYYDLDTLETEMRTKSYGETAQKLLSDLTGMGCTHLYVQQSNSRIRALLAAVDPTLEASRDYSLFVIENKSGQYVLIPCPYVDQS